MELSILNRKIQIFLGKEACNPAQKIINIHKFKLTLNCKKGGGVPWYPTFGFLALAF